VTGEILGLRSQMELPAGTAVIDSSPDASDHEAHCESGGYRVLAARRRATPPRVSVVVPIFNKQPYLRECLEALSNQSLHDIEVICVDDASTDDSLDVALEHAASDDRVMVLHHLQNAGPGAARNLGIGQARGTFVQFTDADDILPKESLLGLSAVAAADDVRVVRGTLGHFTETPAKVWFEEGQVMTDRSRFPLVAEPRLWIPYFHVCYLFDRQFLNENGLSYPPLRCGEDPVFLAACLVNARALSTTSEVCYLYRRLNPHYRRTVVHAMDFIKHVDMIRALYFNSGNERCWIDKCDEFYFQDTQAFIATLSLTESELDGVRAAVRAIWPAASL
jgi:glycosyltransferase involved in cell wall biosynthesis